MSNSIIRCIVSAVVMCAIEAIFSLLNKRDTIVKNEKQNNNDYIVCIPKVLQWVYLILFIVGLFLFLMALITMLMGNPTATMGHLILFLSIAGIGLLVQLWASRWRICVHDNKMEIHRLFHKCIHLSFSQLDQAIMETKKTRYGEKQRIILYHSGKKIVTVDYLSDHYDEFFKTLKQYRKLYVLKP